MNLKSFVTGHNGLVGSSIIETLKKKNKIITVDKKIRFIKSERSE